VQKKEGLRMNKEDLLKSFAEMSTEDQEAIRAELAKGGTEGAGAAGGPMEMKKHMMEMMEKMKTGGDPMALCKEMMEKCGH
jgi:hypothetical protein